MACRSETAGYAVKDATHSSCGLQAYADWLYLLNAKIGAAALEEEAANGARVGRGLGSSYLRAGQPAGQDTSQPAHAADPSVGHTRHAGSLESCDGARYAVLQGFDARFEGLG